MLTLFALSLSVMVSPASTLQKHLPLLCPHNGVSRSTYCFPCRDIGHCNTGPCVSGWYQASREWHRSNMRNSTSETTVGTVEFRRRPGKGKLPCGALYCHRCYEECGVIVHAYVVRNLANESSESDLLAESTISNAARS